ncbi:flagellar export protein FliJ [Syntrophomonas erecta]
MKPFCFRLQTKLDITRHMQQLAQENLQRHINNRNLILAHLQQVERKINLVEQSLRNIEQYQFIPRLMIHKDYLDQQRKKSKDIKERLFREKEKVETARQALLEKVKETRTLERLREKEWQEYLYEVQREEQKIIDELATSRRREPFI